jgi:outer membrane lipoprotein carrier protein
MIKLFALILAVAGLPQAASPPPSPAPLPAKDLNSLVAAVDKTFASMKDFSADFVQFSSNFVNQKQSDEGHLYLTKDRKMRWDYSKPEEMHYVSDGKTLYTYIPRNREVTREAVKESDADQIPMMFLVGRANLRKEFLEPTELKIAPLVAGNRVLHLIPKKKLEDVQSIDIEVNPHTNLIDRMIIWDSDKKSNELIFINIVVNSNIAAEKFVFKVPPGVRVVQGSGSK